MDGSLIHTTVEIQVDSIAMSATAESTIILVRWLTRWLVIYGITRVLITLPTPQALIPSCHLEMEGLVELGTTM
uniref:Uncharacterized protein n=1 Tax=Arundo donax TaxID=35708 RepID=A0A0A8XSF4_ARUDO